MVNFRRCRAIFIRYFFLLTQLDQICDLFYWPALDLLLWGFTAIWVQKSSSLNFSFALLTNLVFWQVVWRGSYDIAVNLLQEFWNRNLGNLFSTPLRLSEWMVGLFSLSCFKGTIILSFSSLVVYFVYGCNIFSIGWISLPFTLILMVFGWSVGLFSASLIVYWGQRIQMIAWMIGYAFAPFSAVFFPLEVLPPWAQSVAHALPTTYIFESIRAMILEQSPASWSLFKVAFPLAIVYLIAAIALFFYSFEKSRAKGLGRFE